MHRALALLWLAACAHPIPVSRPAPETCDDWHTRTDSYGEIQDDRYWGARDCRPAEDGPTGAVDGTVTACGTGEPIAGVRVSTHGVLNVTRTDGYGRFHLDGLRAGKQPLVLEVGGVWVDKCVLIQPGAATKLSATIDTTKGGR